MYGLVHTFRCRVCYNVCRMRPSTTGTKLVVWPTYRNCSRIWAQGACGRPPKAHDSQRFSVWVLVGVQRRLPLLPLQLRLMLLHCHLSWLGRLRRGPHRSRCGLRGLQAG